MDQRLRARVAGEMGKRLVAWRADARGYTPAERWIVTFDDGSSAFVKAATEYFAELLRREAAMYEHLPGGLAPKMLAWSDDDARPALVLDDLSAAVWPPPWDDARIGAVRTLLDAVGAIQPPSHLARAGEVLADHDGGWAGISRDPAPFLSLGVADAAWLERALPTLIDAETRAPLDGDALVHLDVRSDNLCMVSERALLVDWGLAAIGNARLDLAAWLPSLHAEGGPSPDELMNDEPELAAFISGYFASRAGLPADTPSLPRVRAIQLVQLRTALPWTCRLLGLPTPVPHAR